MRPPSGRCPGGSRSCVFPSLIATPSGEERLRERFESGLVADIQPSRRTWRERTPSPRAATRPPPTVDPDAARTARAPRRPASPARSHRSQRPTAGSTARWAAARGANAARPREQRQRNRRYWTAEDRPCSPAHEPLPRHTETSVAPILFAPGGCRDRSRAAPRVARIARRHRRSRWTSAATRNCG
jgi:hypothetical protein